MGMGARVSSLDITNIISTIHNKDGFIPINFICKCMCVSECEYVCMFVKKGILTKSDI